MILSSTEIKDMIEKGSIKIEDFNEGVCLKPASYVLRLSKVFNQLPDPKDGIYDFKNLNPVRKSIIRKERKYIELNPGEFILGRSLEKISLAPDIGAFLSSLSHITRMGVNLLSANYIHPGFGQDYPTQIVFEISSYCKAPIKLYSSMPICHMIFFTVKESTNIKKADQGLKDVASGFLGSRYDLYDEYMRIIQNGQAQENE